jgi:hypothetical protein
MSERIVSGSVRGDGRVIEGQGFHASRTSPGRYLIVFQPPLSDVGSGMVRLIDTRQADALQARVSSLDGLHASITVTGRAQEARDCAFSFVVSGQNHVGHSAPQPADPLAPAQVTPTPAIGSPAPPVLSFPRQQDTNSAPADSSLIHQIEHLKQQMQDVLRPLQRENRMLHSRLAIAARQANGGRKVIPAANGFPGVAAGPLLTRLLRDHPIDTVLDLGRTDLQRLAILAQQDRQVTAVVDTSATAVVSPYVTLLRRAPLTSDPSRPFQCVVAIDLLQRQADPQAFLRLLRSQLAEGGVLALSVPAMRYPLVGGDLSIWSAGLVLYHLVLAGFDCRNVKLLPQDERIFVLLTSKIIAPTAFDAGGPPQPDQLRPYLPPLLEFMETAEGLAFNGDLPAIGWTA